MVISYYEGYVTVTRLNGGLKQRDFYMIKYDGDRNKNAMVELLGNKIDLEPSRKKTISEVVRATVGDRKLNGIYRLMCEVAYSRSLNLEYLKIWRQRPVWTSEDYYNVYKILNDVRITGFMLWKEAVPYVFFTIPIQLVDKNAPLPDRE
ncbi:MAG: hypothetical protein NC308_04290 [Clostridium sp.]|nr:hypothetical protein [Bacteroides sp.]MCM1198086.1 hypothetical protein [Clostridium sp.]